MKLEKILNSTQLPSLPQVAIRLLELSKNPEVDLNDVVKTIKMDPAITIKILKSANSSYFSFRSEITSIERAVPLLGTNVVSSLVLSFSLIDSTTSQGPLAKHYREYWRQSIAQAAVAETIGMITDGGIACENFLAGLLMDVGRLAMLRVLNTEYLPVLDAFTGSSESFLHALEKQQFDFDHAIVGAELLQKWGLDPCLADVARFHHLIPSEIQQKHELPHFKLIKTAALAAAVCDYFCNSNIAIAREKILTLGTSLFDFDSASIENMLSEARIRIDAVAEMFAVDVSTIGDPQQLLVLANEQLAQVAIKNQAAVHEALSQRHQIEQAKLQLENQNLQLREQAFVDPLTGIYNRRFFDEALTREIIRCRREGNWIGIVMLDIDLFKKLNDTHGHPFGDFVLKAVAATLRHAIRETDVLARYGGEEFILLAHQPTPDGLHVLAERLRSAVESLQPENEGTIVPVTISVGAAMARADILDTMELKIRLISLADQLLYQAKKNGRNRALTEVLTSCAFPAVDISSSIPMTIVST